MARKIIPDEDGPYIVDEDEFKEQGGTIAICQCGLSGNRPFCDGSHTAVADEVEGVLYEYDSDGTRREVEE